MPELKDLESGTYWPGQTQQYQEDRGGARAYTSMQYEHRIGWEFYNNSA